MPYQVTTKETTRIGTGLKAQAAIKIQWAACNHLGHLSRAETAHTRASRTSPLGQTAPRSARASTAVSAHSHSRSPSRRRAASEAAGAGSTASGGAGVRPLSIVEYQVPDAPAAWCLCAWCGHVGLGVVWAC
jgi:hypothetical protein